MHHAVTFHWRQPGDPLPKGVAWFMALFFLVTVTVILWQSPFTWSAVSAVDWHVLWQKVMLKPDVFIQLLLTIVAAIGLILGGFLHRSRARLVLDDRNLSYQSGLPILERWLDWCLDLDAVRSGKTVLRLGAQSNNAYAFGPKCYVLNWGAAGLSGRALCPASWYLPHEPVQRPALFFNLVLWPSDKAKAAAQEKIKALPLVRALAQRGIELPPLGAKPSLAGIDLMAHKRLAGAVYGFFALIALAVGLMLWVRESYYFRVPPLSTWVAVASIASMCMLAWLWGESPETADESGGGGLLSSAVGFRVTQALLAVLVGVGAGLCAPSVPLLFTNLTQAPQEVTFTLQKLPTELLPPVGSATPRIVLDVADEYWHALPERSEVVLPIRRGTLSLWWQYDARELREKWKAYYAAQP